MKTTYVYSLFLLIMSIGCTSAAESIEDICQQIAKCRDISDLDFETDHHLASYALGVKFQREVATKFDRLEYLSYIRGIMDAKNDKVTQDKDTLNSMLDEVITNEQDQSKYFMKKFIASENVVSMKGIYVIKKITEISFTMPMCKRNLLDNSVFTVAYVRLTMDPTSRTKWDEGEIWNDCINVKESEVIRGWRTAMNAMNVGEIWEVAIPPELAYGSKGLVTSTGTEIGSEVALRFLLRLAQKPKGLLD